MGAIPPAAQPALGLAPAAPLRSGAATPPLARLLSALLPVALAMYANFQGVQQILAPVQVEAIDPPGKIANLAALTMVCSITGILGLAGGGAASDATHSRWGRRTPWLVAMGALSAAFSIALGLQRSLIGIAILYGVLWFTLNFFQAALLAVIPDRIPAKRRSLASSIFGFAGPLGTLVGTGVAAFAPDVRGNLVLALLFAAATAAFVAFAREEPRLAPDAEAEPTPRPRLRLSLSALQSFASRDYALAYVFRILMFTGQFSINNYLLYILQDHIGLAHLPGHKAQIAAGALNSLRILMTVSAIFIGLWFAHRTERRKLFAQGYAVLMALGMLVVAATASWPGMLAFAVLGGLAMGVYGTVDLDLMSRVLPDKNSAGRDLALLVMAGAAAQFLAPLLSGAVIKTLGYDALFVVAAAITLAAGAVTTFIRGVR